MNKLDILAVEIVRKLNGLTKTDVDTILRCVQGITSIISNVDCDSPNLLKHIKEIEAQDEVNRKHSTE